MSSFSYNPKASVEPLSKLKLNIPKEVEVKSIKSGKNALTYTLEDDGYYVTVPEIQSKSNCNIDIKKDSGEQSKS